MALTKIRDAGLPEGSVLQVVSNFITTDFNTNSTSFVTTGLSQAITPTSTSSKILCLVSIPGWYLSGSGGESHVTVYRGSTNLGTGTANALMYTVNDQLRIPSTTQVLDSPATTSATTYTVYGKVGSSSNTTYISYPSYGHFTITLMEIAG
jgi:hypothetical protein|tara:strand:- start:345 stop:797 length:453 start_codon:yes stop_codon:yes gene_type:complete